MRGLALRAALRGVGQELVTRCVESVASLDAASVEMLVSMEDVMDFTSSSG